MEQLYLGANQIGDKGAKALAGPLASGHLQTLQQLRLDTNRIGEERAKALADTLVSGSGRTFI